MVHMGSADEGQIEMNDNWETPKWLMEHFKNHFDPCPTNPQFDGLKIDWQSPAFVNPPYSDPYLWVEKAIEETKKGIDVVLLLRVDVSTRFYRKIIEENPHISFFNERLKFSESKDSPNFSSMLVFLEGKKVSLNECSLSQRENSREMLK